MLFRSSPSQLLCVCTEHCFNANIQNHLKCLTFAIFCIELQCVKCLHTCLCNNSKMLNVHHQNCSFVSGSYGVLLLSHCVWLFLPFHFSESLSIFLSVFPSLSGSLCYSSITLLFFLLSSRFVLLTCISFLPFFFF